MALAAVRPGVEPARSQNAYFVMATDAHRPAWKTLVAFGIIYFVWGSTFLAIRVGVREVPPFLFAAMRFSIAGLVLCLWTVARKERLPRGREWASAFALATLIFVLDYGLLFWSEQRVPSGIAAVMLALIPVFMALSEIILLRTQKLTVRLAVALLIGIDDLVDCVGAHAQTATAILQSHEFRSADAAWGNHAGLGGRGLG